MPHMHDLKSSPIRVTGKSDLGDQLSKTLILDGWGENSIAQFKSPPKLTSDAKLEGELEGLLFTGVRVRIPDGENEYRDFVFGTKPLWDPLLSTTIDRVIIGARLVSVH